MQRLRTIAVVAFAACDGERARRPLVHAGTIDLATVEVVARLRLGAQRCGLVMTLYEPAPELSVLLGLTGIGELLTINPQSR